MPRWQLLMQASWMWAAWEGRSPGQDLGESAWQRHRLSSRKGQMVSAWTPSLGMCHPWFMSAVGLLHQCSAAFV